MYYSIGMEMDHWVGVKLCQRK